MADLAPGTKLDAGKPRWSLLPPEALALTLAVLEFGARKYTPDGWRHVPDARRRYFDAAQRHLWAWWQGERNDPESGLPHLGHALCCLAFLAALDAPTPEAR